MKFNTGDKVVYIGGTILKHGAVYTVHKVTASLLASSSLVQVKEEPLLVMLNDKFVLEEIYNSPLYKALEET